MAGMVGALVAGFAADRIFRGRAGRVCVIAMICMCGAVLLFWKSPKHLVWVSCVLYILMAFFLYIPQMLIAAMAMNLGTKRASAAAVGLTGIIGYASTIITGVGIGSLVQRGLVIFGHRIANPGWPAAFQLMLLCAGITMLLMLLTWNVGAHEHLKHKH
jgi:OPA family glycerol-3-phosphate transporter-like MFS transporter/OPA family sugar phosphate sensor protein UhpC-like MFS transporter